MKTEKIIISKILEKFIALGSDIVMDELENVSDPYKESLMGLMEKYNLEKITVDEGENLVVGRWPA